MLAIASRGFTRLPTAMIVTSLVMSGFNGILASAVSLPSYQIVLLRSVIAAAILGLIRIWPPLPARRALALHAGIEKTFIEISAAAVVVFVYALLFKGVGVDIVFGISSAKTPGG